MNVYDFDKTIYSGDSTLDFFIYCVKRQPLLILLLPIQIYGFVMYKLGFYRKLQFKEKFYIFLKYLKNRETMLKSFWDEKEHKIYDWYKQNQAKDDVIISASPEFLLRPICNRLGIGHLIASKISFETGKASSENCYGEEKVVRFHEIFPNEIVDSFYSDSLTDAPMANLAKESYGVVKGRVISWRELELLPKSNTVKEFLLFIVVGIINTFNGVLFATMFSFYFSSTVAFILGYACSLIVSYLLNSKFVFISSLSFLKFIKFCISYIPNFVIQLLVVIVFVNLVSIPDYVIYTIAAIIGVPVTFLLVKFFALKK